MPFPVRRTCGLVYRSSRELRNFSVYYILALGRFANSVTMAAGPTVQAVSRWLQQTKGVTVQDEWLGACTEWILNEEVAGRGVWMRRRRRSNPLRPLTSNDVYP